MLAELGIVVNTTWYVLSNEQSEAFFHARRFSRRRGHTEARRNCLSTAVPFNTWGTTVRT